MPRLGRIRTMIRVTPQSFLSVVRTRKGPTPAIADISNAPTSLTSTSTGVSPVHHKVDPGSTRVTRSVSLGATKEVLLLGLEALAESADAFLPLKSAVCGLLFFVKQADVSPQIARPSHLLAF